MLWTEELFHVKKPIIAMLHLEPLPGDPLFSRSTNMQQIADLAKRDLEALQRGGVDGVLISNEFSLPYQRKVDTVTTAAMAFVLGQLCSEISVPYGVDCISDGDATIELAAAVDADFVRGTFCGVYVGDGGLYNNDFSATLRRKAALGLEDLRMLYFLNPESDRNLDTRALGDIARSLIFKAAPDGLCISASAAGQEVDDQLIQSVKECSPDMVVLCNMLFNVLIVLAVPILRKKFPNIERPYKVWLYPVSIIFTAVVFVALFVNSAIENPFLGSLGFIVPAIGAVVYLIFDRKLKKEAGEDKEANDG